MMEPYGGHAWGGMGWGGIVMLLFWILAIAGVIVWLRRVRARDLDPDREARRTALDTLKERYARGEIDREEFEQKRRDLDA
jgi:putative membrane protein